jgi:beta-N-acetylhexosaminidase
LPATLSPRILTDLLRREIGFRGLIVTDCLEMSGIASHWDLGEAAVLAVLAGADLLLCCHTLSRQQRTRDGLVEAVRSGRIPESRIDESLARIAAAKAKWIRSVPGRFERKLVRL